MSKKEGSLRIFSRDHHVGREDLAGEHPIGDAGQIVGFILFLLIWLGDSFHFRFSTILAESIPLYVRLAVAVPIFLFSGYLARSGLKTVFQEVRETPRVIQDGVFSISRHPIYLSALLLYLGFFLTTLSLISMVLLGALFMFYNFIAAFEERLLEETFGQEYKDYKEETPRWLLWF
jgi:protein-S-isoprenylcysteine O-methyltransferase Ste14